MVRFCVTVVTLSFQRCAVIFSLSPMHLSIAILAPAIAAPQLHNLAHPTPIHKPARAVFPVDTPPPSSGGQLNAHVIDVSGHTYGELERFARYASAAYQYLGHRQLGNTLMRSLSCARVSRLLVCLLITLLGIFAVVLQSIMGSWRVPFGGARLLLHIESVPGL
jgi:hypothetical protein